MMRRFLRRAAPGVVWLSVACGDAGPQGPTGEYELVRVNGQPLPFTNTLVAISDTTCQPTVDRGELTLAEEQAYEASYQLRRACMREGVVNTETYEEHGSGTYRVTDALIEFRGESTLREGAAAEAEPDTAGAAAAAQTDEAAGIAAGAADAPVMQGTIIADTLSLYHQPLGLTLTFVRRAAQASD